MKEKISWIDCKTCIILTPKESIFKSIVKDLFMFVIIAFCVYISKDSTWWTFVTGGMFIYLVFTRINNLITENAKTFKDIDKAIKYLESKREEE